MHGIDVGNETAEDFSAEINANNIPLLKAMGSNLVTNPSTFEWRFTLYAAHRIWEVYLFKDEKSIQLISNEDNIVLREYFYGNKFIHSYFDEENVSLAIANFDILNGNVPVVKVDKRGGGHYA